MTERKKRKSGLTYFSFIGFSDTNEGKRKASNEQMVGSSLKKMKQTGIWDYFARSGSNDEQFFLCEQPDCTFKGISYDSLIMHESRFHPRSQGKKFIVDPTNTFMCELCQKTNPISFHTQIEKLNHLATNHSEYMGSYCPTCKKYVAGLNANCHHHAYEAHSLTNDNEPGDWEKMKNWKKLHFIPFQNMIKGFKTACLLKVKNAGMCVLETPKKTNCCYLCGEEKPNKKEYDQHVLSCVYKNNPSDRLGGKETDVREGEEKREKERDRQKDGDRGIASPKVGNLETEKNVEKPEGSSARNSDFSRLQEPETENKRKSENQRESEIRPENESDPQFSHIIYNMKTRKIRRGEGTLISFKSTEINDDLPLMISLLRARIKSCLEDNLKKTGQCKVIPNLIVLFRKDNPILSDESDLALDKIRHILCKAREINMISDLNNYIDEWEAEFEGRIEAFTEEESGYYVVDLLSLELKIFPFKAFSAGNCAHLPSKMIKFLGRKWKTKLIIPENITDQTCVLYAVALQLEIFDREKSGYVKKK